MEQWKDLISQSSEVVSCRAWCHACRDSRDSVTVWHHGPVKWVKPEHQGPGARARESNSQHPRASPGASGTTTATGTGTVGGSGSARILGRMHRHSTEAARLFRVSGFKDSDDSDSDGLEGRLQSLRALGCTRDHPAVSVRAAKGGA